MIAAAHAKRHGASAVRAAERPWYIKPEPTFADALACVRRLLWRDTILATPRTTRGLNKSPPAIRRLVLDALAHAA